MACTLEWPDTAKMPLTSMAHVKYNKYINNWEEEIGSVAKAVAFLPLHFKIRRCDLCKCAFLLSFKDNASLSWKKKKSTQAESFKYENSLCNLISGIVGGTKHPGDEPGQRVQGHHQRHLESNGHLVNSMGRKLFIPWRLSFSISWGLEVFSPTSQINNCLFNSS